MGFRECIRHCTCVRPSAHGRCGTSVSDGGDRGVGGGELRQRKRAQGNGTAGTRRKMSKQDGNRIEGHSKGRSGACTRLRLGAQRRTKEHVERAVERQAKRTRPTPEGENQQLAQAATTGQTDEGMLAQRAGGSSSSSSSGAMGAEQVNRKLKMENRSWTRYKCNRGGEKSLRK